MQFYCLGVDIVDLLCDNDYYLIKHDPNIKFDEQGNAYCNSLEHVRKIEKRIGEYFVHPVEVLFYYFIEKYNLDENKLLDLKEMFEDKINNLPYDSLFIENFQLWFNNLEKEFLESYTDMMNNYEEYKKNYLELLKYLAKIYNHDKTLN